MEELDLALDWAEKSFESIVGGVILGLIIFIIGRLLAKWISDFTERRLEQAKVDPTVVRYARVTIYAGLLITVITVALNTAGINIASLTALLVSAGLAVSLALRDELGNFAAGVVILLTIPFKIDDQINVAGTSGAVEEVNLLNTVLRAPDNARVIVPNSSVTGANVLNYTANGTRRVNLVVGIGYENSLEKARNLLLDICTSHALVLDDPAPVVNLIELTTYKINLSLHLWTDCGHYERVRADILEQIKQRFDQVGIRVR